MTSPPDGSPLASVVERNIRSLLERRRREEAARPLHERVSGQITRLAGSLGFVYVQAALVLAWVAINAGWTALPRFDPSFVILGTAVSCEAIFLTAFVLIAQNRMSAQAERRAELDLQISLLAEHEVTRLIKLVSAIAARVGAEQPDAEELVELARDVAPDQVLDRLEGDEPTTH